MTWKDVFMLEVMRGGVVILFCVMVFVFLTGASFGYWTAGRVITEARAYFKRRAAWKQLPEHLRRVVLDSRRLRLTTVYVLEASDANVRLSMGLLLKAVHKSRVFKYFQLSFDKEHAIVTFITPDDYDTTLWPVLSSEFLYIAPDATSHLPADHELAQAVALRYSRKPGASGQAS